MRQRIGPTTIIGSLIILVWCLLPVVWIIMLSFKPAAETAAGSPQFLPEDWTWDNFQTVWEDDQFRRSLFNSFGISFISTALSVILATLAAYAIARLNFKGKRLVLSLALAIAMFPVVVTRRPAVRLVDDVRVVQHVARIDHPLHVVHAAARHLDALGVLP